MLKVVCFVIFGFFVSASVYGQSGPYRSFVQCNDHVCVRKSVQLAQYKAMTMANSDYRGHVSKDYGGYRYEGVGWSNQGPQQAIQKCCFWGVLDPKQIGVQRGHNGIWYATVLY